MSRKMHFKFGIVVFILVVALFVQVFAVVDFGELSYYHSNSSTIGTWTTTPTLYFTLYSPYATTASSMESATTIADSKWSGAGVPLVKSSTSTNIRVHTGEYDTIKALYPSFVNGVIGETVPTWTTYGTATYNSATKTVKKITSAKIYYVPKATYKDDFIVTHEVGHAIGWVGHSAVYGEVMYSQAMSNTGSFVLSTNEKNHIGQIY